MDKEKNGTVNFNISKEGINEANKAKKSKKRLKTLNKGKTKSLGFIERMSMKYAGWVDGRKGLLRCNANGIWQSSTLKQEIDSYEEFCAKQFADLKVEEEEEFRQMNILFDKIIPLRKKLDDAKRQLSVVIGKEMNQIERKEGEENLTEVQVIARRNREREEQLQPLRKKVITYETQLSATIEDIFTRLSQVKESFDSTIKGTNRILQHCQRRVDLYWHSAMCYIPDLPALPNVVFSDASEQAFATHYNKVVEKAENLRMELASELYEEEK